jgi:hypothetical protein
MKTIMAIVIVVVVLWGLVGMCSAQSNSTMGTVQSDTTFGGVQSASANAIYSQPGTVDLVVITNNGAADCTVQICDSLTFAGCTAANSLMPVLTCVASLGTTCTTPSKLNLGFTNGLSAVMVGAGCTYSVSGHAGR